MNSKDSEYEIKIEGLKEEGKPLLISGEKKDGTKVDLFAINYDLDFQKPRVSSDKQRISLTLTFEVESFEAHKVKIVQSLILSKETVRMLARDLDLIE